MKERGSDREKGSAKSCQPEIKQAGTLPIPKPLHPPQSHILPLHSLYLYSLPPCFHLPSLYSTFLQIDIFKPWFDFGPALWFYLSDRHTCVITCASHQTCPCITKGFSMVTLQPTLGPHNAFVYCPIALKPVCQRRRTIQSGNNTAVLCGELLHELLAFLSSC